MKSVNPQYLPWPGQKKVGSDFHQRSIAGGICRLFARARKIPAAKEMTEFALAKLNGRARRSARAA
jgi:hypothetical protein